MTTVDIQISVTTNVRFGAYRIDTYPAMAPFSPLAFQSYTSYFNGPSLDFTIGALDLVNFVFPTIQDAYNYAVSNFGPSFLSSLNAQLFSDNPSLGSSFYSAYRFVKYNNGLDDDLAAKVDKVTGKQLSTEDYTTAEKTKLAGLSPALARSTSTPTRTVGTSFQASTTRDALVIYSLPIQCSATLVVGSKGTMSMQYADNSAMTTNPISVPGDEFGLASGLVVTSNGTLKVVSFIPAGKWIKLTTTNTLGSPTYGALVAQEVLL